VNPGYPLLGRRLVHQHSRGDLHLNLVVEGDQTEPIGRVQPVDEFSQRPLGGIQPGTRHRAAPVQDHDQSAGGRRLPRIGGRCGQLEEK
jgi:hypothetical protein